MYKTTPVTIIFSFKSGDGLETKIWTYHWDTAKQCHTV